ncbi:hypothetical protein ACWDRX_20450 [Streptomyces nigra]
MSLRHTVAGLAFLPLLALPTTAQAATHPHPTPSHESPHQGAFDLQAHRGGLGLTTEESLEGFGKALRLGVSTLELDTQITAVQAIGIPVVAGGAAFGADGRYARLLGADAWAPDARTAAGLLERGLPRPAGGAVRQSVDDLPHLIDQEYTLVTRARRQVVRSTLAGLEERVPAMRDYSAEQRERTAEDVLHIVEFLACALYTDDDSLFTGFLDWTADILEARQVPARVLDPTLVLLQDELKDFPRTLCLLAEGRDTLRRRAARPPAPESGAPV